MRKRPTKWLCLLGLAGSTLFLSCPTAIALEFLDSALQGAYRAASEWGSDAFIDLLSRVDEAAGGGG